MDRYGRLCTGFKAYLYGGPRDGVIVPLPGPEREIRIAVHIAKGELEVHSYGVAGKVYTGPEEGWCLAFEWRGGE